MTELYPSFAPPEKWRKKRGEMGKDWAAIRKSILERDNYTCIYCGYKSYKYQIVHHIDDNPKNNEKIIWRQFARCATLLCTQGRVVW